MTDRYIICDASEVDVVNFFRRLTGKSPRTRAEIAEADARNARIRLAELIQRTEYAKARREREALIRDRIINGSQGLSDEDWKVKLNLPLIRAAERVNARISDMGRKDAA